MPGPDAAIVREWVRSCDPKPVVLVDSVVAFLEGDENSASDMRAFMNGPRKLADMGATVINVHHDGKADSARDFRGSSDFKGSVDQAFHIANLGAGKLDRITLRTYKSRYGFAGSLIYLYAGGKFVRDDRADAPARTVGAQLTELLRTNPGSTGTAFEALAAKKGISRNKARDFLSNGSLSGAVRREPGARNVHRHYLAEGVKNDAV